MDSSFLYRIVLYHIMLGCLLCLKSASSTATIGDNMYIPMAFSNEKYYQGLSCWGRSGVVPTCGWSLLIISDQDLYSVQVSGEDTTIINSRKFTLNSTPWFNSDLSRMQKKCSVLDMTIYSDQFVPNLDVRFTHVCTKDSVTDSAMTSKATTATIPIATTTEPTTTMATPTTATIPIATTIGTMVAMATIPEAKKKETMAAISEATKKETTAAKTALAKKEVAAGKKTVLASSTLPAAYPGKHIIDPTQIYLRKVNDGCYTGSQLSTVSKTSNVKVCSSKCIPDQDCVGINIWKSGCDLVRERPDGSFKKVTDCQYYEVVWKA